MVLWPAILLRTTARRALTPSVRSAPPLQPQTAISATETTETSPTIARVYQDTTTSSWLETVQHTIVYDVRQLRAMCATVPPQPPAYNVLVITELLTHALAPWD